MKKKKYGKPSMKVHELKHKTMLLQGSPVGARSAIDDWINGGTTEDDIYM